MGSRRPSAGEAVIADGSMFKVDTALPSCSNINIQQCGVYAASLFNLIRLIVSTSWNCVYLFPSISRYLFSGRLDAKHTLSLFVRLNLVSAVAVRGSKCVTRSLTSSPVPQRLALAPAREVWIQKSQETKGLSEEEKKKEEGEEGLMGE